MHVAIVAKALNVPVIAGIEGLFKDVKDGAVIAVDGADGSVYVNPPKAVIEKFRPKWRKKERTPANTETQKFKKQDQRFRKGKPLYQYRHGF